MLQRSVCGALTVLISASLLSFQTASQKKEVNIGTGFMKAEEFLNLSKDRQTAFSMGFVDGMFLSPFFDAPDDNQLLKSIKDCLQGMSDTQISAIIEKHLRDHPEEWHSQLNVAAFNALNTACPAK